MPNTDPVVKDNKTLAKSAVQDRALLFLLEHRAKVDGLSAAPEALLAELRDTMGLSEKGPVDQFVQSAEAKGADRDANRAAAVDAAKAAGLVGDDHEPGADNPVATKDQHPTSASPVAANAPAAVPASEAKDTPEPKK